MRLWTREPFRSSMRPLKGGHRLPNRSRLGAATDKSACARGCVDQREGTCLHARRDRDSRRGHSVRLAGFDPEHRRTDSYSLDIAGDDRIVYARGCPVVGCDRSAPLSMVLRRGLLHRDRNGVGGWDGVVAPDRAPGTLSRNRRVDVRRRSCLRNARRDLAPRHPHSVGTIPAGPPTRRSGPAHAGIDLNNAGFGIVGLFVLTWLFAITYWKLAGVAASDPYWLLQVRTGDGDGTAGFTPGYRRRKPRRS